MEQQIAVTGADGSCANSVMLMLVMPGDGHGGGDADGDDADYANPAGLYLTKLIRPVHRLLS